MLGPIIAAIGTIAYTLRTGEVDGAAIFVWCIFGAIVLIGWLFERAKGKEIVMRPRHPW